jgi:phosphosulfolactate synthase (CoM biosynthesis protein A)
MPSKTPFKQKIKRILFIILGFLGTFLIGFLTKLFLGKKTDENEAKEKMDDSVNTVKNDIDAVKANVEVIQDAVDKAKEAAKTDTTEDRINFLEEAGVVIGRRKK